MTSTERPAPSPAASQPLLVLDNISRSYPGVRALADVTLSVAPGEVLALIGENGAGKSTLMKILGGVIPPSAGSIVIDGVRHESLSVLQSQAAGIAFVHQELNILDNLDVAGNIFLGREPRNRLGLMDITAMRRAAAPLLQRVGARFRPETPAAELSLAERQLLEIAKGLAIKARIVIMDEPSSSLTVKETRTLLELIAGLKADGIAVIYISHRLGEVQDCADRVVGLRDGRVAGELKRGEISHDAMIRLMIGRDLKALYTPPSRPAGAPVLALDAVQVAATPGGKASLVIRRGEIVGVAGLVGAGRTELAEAIFGIGTVTGGSMRLEDAPYSAATPREAIAAGVYLVPEDRKRAGLVLDTAISENVALPDLPAMAPRGLVSGGRILARAETQKQKLDIRAADLTRNAGDLSGGNQQKVVLGKWLAMQPKLIIFDEPTRGIDVGAKSEIYRLMRELAEAGVGVMMISSDMEEVIGVSDRIVVLREGRVAGELARPEFSEQNVLRLAVGAGEGE